MAVMDKETDSKERDGHKQKMATGHKLRPGYPDNIRS